MSDDLDIMWENFYSERVKPLRARYPGSYRALVVETNDPLNMRRVRFKLPELHDWDLKPEECPWAVPAYDLGTKRCGRFSYPCIGDWVWIAFEKNHPYGPIYTGFADPTRRKFYPLPSVHGTTQMPVNIDSKIEKPVVDYDKNYLPKDGRPYNHGWQDRYGNLDIHNSTGFFPVEHDVLPPPADADPLARSNFQQSKKKPEVNDPDSKMMCRVTKYGMLFIQSDAGYKWKKEDDQGEFEGDFDKDEEFEIKRWLYMQRLMHEDKATGHDARKIMSLTRYGHKFEMRDTGWNKTRIDEWDAEKKRVIGDGDDERWVKLRTKGGHLIELCDIGFDPEDDEYVSRLLLDEISDTYLDREDQYPKKQSDWNKSGTRDMRMLRFVTRSGLKIALDDRESHDGGEYRLPKNSAFLGRLNEEIGTGILIKGRATPGTKDEEPTKYGKKSGDPRGYFWQFDERPGRNSTTWGTPMGQVVEMDDNEELMAICSRLPKLPTKWKYLDDNEFLVESVESFEPAGNTHHLIIDHGREAIRLKTRAGKGEASKNKKLGEAASGTHAGLEIHDAPISDPWAELIDIDQRGMWFSREQSIGIWRAKSGSDICIWLDDGDEKKNKNIVVRNNEGGKVQIYCSGDIELVSNTLVSIAAPHIEMKADEIKLDAGGTPFTFAQGSMRTTKNIYASNVYAKFPTAERPSHINGVGTGRQAGSGSPVSNLLKPAELPKKIQPDNRLA